MKTTNSLMCILFGLAATLSIGSPVCGAPVALPANLSGAGASWIGVNASFPGRSVIADGNISGQGDAYDGALALSINSSGVIFPATGDLTGSTITTDATTNGVFSTVGEYFASQTVPVLRGLFSITNTSGSIATANISMQTNVGADNSTTILGTSSGDTTYTTADSWAILDDFSGGGDPTTTNVFYGANASETTTFSSTTVFSSAGTQGVRADFDLAIAPGETQRLMFFLRMDANIADASGYTGTWDDMSTLDAAGLLSGLNATTQSQIVNWSVVPEPSTLLLGALASLGMLVRRRWRS
ncbi:MAG: PEP-CTERM sorting domain-containing protein [Planctomycetes bacterium]|nr:PEP-CTERM sorting domain-containing protein [Planctomycetota bacterium]